MEVPLRRMSPVIPSKYTAYGQDISPPIAWDGLPEGTKSIALINDDPEPLLTCDFCRGLYVFVIARS